MMCDSKSLNDVLKLEDVLVSVCITSYNRAKGLDDLLQCIRNQTHKNLQIIITDDCSTDENVKKTILRHSQKDKRIESYTQNKNLFYFKNLKFALDRAIGQFVMWCDDDDFYHHEYIEKCLSALLNNTEAISAFSYYYEADELGVVDTHYPKQDKLLERLTNKNVVCRLLAYLFVFNGYGYCNIYYSLHRRSRLSWFNPEKFGLTIDMDFGMKSISISPLLLVKEHLFKKTVGNSKKYLTQTAGKKSKLKLFDVSKKISTFFIFYIKQAIRYTRILRLDFSILIVIFSPIWIATLFINNLYIYLKKNTF